MNTLQGVTTVAQVLQYLVTSKCIWKPDVSEPTPVELMSFSHVRIVKNRRDLQDVQNIDTNVYIALQCDSVQEQITVRFVCRLLGFISTHELHANISTTFKILHTIPDQCWSEKMSLQRSQTQDPVVVLL